MKKKNNKKDFTNLESIYRHLEKNAIDYEYPTQIGDLFQKLRDLSRKKKKSEDAKKAQWEIDFFYFRIEEGEIRSFSQIPNNKGEIVEFPTLDRFDEDTYNYLIKRMENTSNPLLKARYSHILWCSPKKHNKYAKIATDSYLELIKIYEEKDKEEPQKHYGLEILKIAKNAYLIVYQAQYKMAKIKAELRRLVLKFNFMSSSSFILRSSLIKFMLERKRQFPTKYLDCFEKICKQMAEDLDEKGSIFQKIAILELGEKVDDRLRKKTYDWRRKIAKSYETLMKIAKKNDSLAAINFCLDALENYKKLKDKKKIKELESKYDELIKSVKLQEFEQEIDIGRYGKKCREVAEKLSQESPEKIIRFLMLNKDLLPRYSEVKKSAEAANRGFPLGYIFLKKIFDQNGNIIQYFSDEQEKNYYSVLQTYSLQLQYNKIFLINEIFFAVVRVKKLSPKTLLNFLIKYSWFGKNIQRKVSNKVIEYNWLNLIIPAINEYFNQMHYYFLNPGQNHPNFVLCIDSTTLKIEGLIRDICQLSEITTFVTKKDRKGRNIVEEKDINALLYEEKMKELFDEDDLFFFRFLLIEKVGSNLRNKVAHSLLKFKEYDVSYMHLLILALLRLGKYDFVKKEDVSTQNPGKKV